MEETMKQGKAMDDSLQKYENKFLRGEEVTRSDIFAAADECHKMTELLKQASRLSAGLRSWFGLTLK